MDSFQAFGATLKYDNKLEDKQVSYVQVAVLYTTAGGERRVRVLNLSLPATNHIGNVFRFADFDTSVVMLLKEGEDDVGCRRSVNCAI
jgi:protein transport protein SEC24